MEGKRRTGTNQTPRFAASGHSLDFFVSHEHLQKTLSAQFKKKNMIKNMVRIDLGKHYFLLNAISRVFTDDVTYNKWEYVGYCGDISREA